MSVNICKRQHPQSSFDKGDFCVSPLSQRGVRGDCFILNPPKFPFGNFSCPTIWLGTGDRCLILSKRQEEFEDFQILSYSLKSLSDYRETSYSCFYIIHTFKIPLFSGPHTRYGSLPIRFLRRQIFLFCAKNKHFSFMLPSILV